MENYERKYKDALERASKLKVQNPFDTVGQMVEHIFPELKESEDERIRKELIAHCKNTRCVTKEGAEKISKWITWLEKQKEPELKESREESEDEKIRKELYIYLDWLDGRKDYAPKGNYSIKDMIAWLEKLGKGKSALEAWKDMRLEVYLQASGNRHEPNYSDDSTKMFSLNDIDEIIEKISEQKSDDKVEPKFEVGDWVVNNVCLPMQIASIKDGMYVFTKGDAMSVLFIDGNYRLWTIEDAKDGDVLVDEDNNIGLYLEEKDDLYWHSRIYLGCDNCLRGFSIGGYHKHKNTKPATKNQRDILFAKIKGAGYEWDSKKKELEKIEQKPVDKIESKFRVGNWYQCTKDFFGKGVTFDKNTAYYCAKEGCLLDGCHIAIVKDLYDNFKLWTIEDAKDGDVLAAHECFVLFKELNGLNIKCYCTYHYMNNPSFHIDTLQNKDAFHPATKEQRDTLMKAMANAGYEWDADKKELKKIEVVSKEGEGEQSKNWILEYLRDGLRKTDEQFKDQFKTAIAWLEKQGHMLDPDKVI